MALRRLGQAGWTSQPWRNGGGVTHEVVAGRLTTDGAAPVDGWDYRVSVAQVASDGPFSRFEGVDRWLVLLTGGGVALRSSVGWERTLAPGMAPLRFAGEEAVDARLVAGPVRDLNVMVRRGAAAAEVCRLELTAAPVTPGDPGALRLVFVLEGSVRIGGDGPVLAPLETLLIEPGDEDVTLAGEGGEAKVLAVTLRTARTGRPER